MLLGTHLFATRLTKPMRVGSLRPQLVQGSAMAFHRQASTSQPIGKHIATLAASQRNPRRGS